MEGLTRMRRTSEHLTMMEVVGQDGATDWEHLKAQQFGAAKSVQITCHASVIFVTSTSTM